MDVVSKSESGYDYESLLVDLDSDWEKLKKEIAKFLASIKVVTGSLYEKLVARRFQILCSSEKPKKQS